MWWTSSCKKELPKVYDFCKNILGFRPRKAVLYRTALLHRSHSTAVAGHKVNNERLEYLGDAVLGAVVADYLYHKYPLQGEGYLTVLRSKIVSRASLGRLADKIGLVQLVQHEHQSGGVFKSMGGDAFEALVGAIYLDCGYRRTRHIIVDNIIRRFMDVDQLAVSDWNFKSKLIDWGQKQHRKVQFEVVRSYVQGPGGRKLYECRVSIDGKAQPTTGTDFTIKAAEQLAAERTYKAIVANNQDKEENNEKTA